MFPLYKQSLMGTLVAGTRGPTKDCFSIKGEHPRPAP